LSVFGLRWATGTGPASRLTAMRTI
jgi:hypothetical protein